MAKFLSGRGVNGVCYGLCVLACWTASSSPVLGALTLADALTDSKASSLGLDTSHFTWSGGVNTSSARAIVNGGYYVRGWAAGSTVSHWYHVGASTYNATPDRFTWLSPSTAAALSSVGFLGSGAVASNGVTYSNATGLTKRATWTDGTVTYYYVEAFSSTVATGKWYQTNQETYDLYGGDTWTGTDTYRFNSGVHAVSGDTAEPLAVSFSSPSKFPPAIDAHAWASGLFALGTHYFGFFVSGLILYVILLQIRSWFSERFRAPEKVSKREAKIRDAAVVEDEWRTREKAEKADKQWRKENVRSFGADGKAYDFDY